MGESALVLCVALPHLSRSVLIALYGVLRADSGPMRRSETV